MNRPSAPDWNAERLHVKTPAPSWFNWAVESPLSSNFVEVEGCPIHYLVWPGDDERANERGLLLVHGGGAHANWWRFIGPFFTRYFRVAAIDQSGMGDSGTRDDYDAEIRVEEIRAVIEHGGLGRMPFVVGHSFGGFMTMRLGATYGEEIGGAVIVDSPIRRPSPDHKPGRPAVGHQRFYPSFDDALARFRLLPAQDCENEFIVELIARHSLRKIDQGWTWKFDVKAMGSRRWGEPFHEHLQKLRCRAGLIFGQNSALVSRDTADYMSELMGPDAPVVEIPEAQHHVMLDQPIAFVAALRTLLDGWVRAETEETSI